MNKSPRCLTLLFATLIAASTAVAQSFPTKPIRILVGTPPGTSPDLGARLSGGEMERRLGQPVIIENRPGANGTIAAKAVVNAAPDGYSLYYGPAAISLHPIHTKDNAVDASKELVPVSDFMSIPFYFFTSAKLPVKSVQELIAHAKANPPGKLNFVAFSGGTDLAMELMKDRTGITFTPIPYPSSVQAINALLVGEVDMEISTSAGIQPHVQAGTVRALFSLTTKRTALFPDLPTAAEVGIRDFVLGVNLGHWAPRGTPRDIVQKLSEAVAAAAKVPAIAEKARSAVNGEMLGSTPEEQLRNYEADVKFMAKAARLANFKPR